MGYYYFHYYYYYYYYSSLVRKVGVVHPPGVEPLELPVLIVGEQLLGVLLLAPVHISGLAGQSSNIGTHKDNADPHDGEEGLEGDVVLDAGHGGALWGPH